MFACARAPLIVTFQGTSDSERSGAHDRYTSCYRTNVLQLLERRGDGTGWWGGWGRIDKRRIVVPSEGH